MKLTRVQPTPTTISTAESPTKMRATSSTTTAATPTIMKVTATSLTAATQ